MQKDTNITRLKDTGITLSIVGNKLPNSGFEPLVSIDPGFGITDQIDSTASAGNPSYYTLVIREDITYIIKTIIGVCSYGGMREGRFRIGFSVPKGLTVHDPVQLILDIENEFKSRYMTQVAGKWQFKNETADPAVFQQTINRYPLIPINGVRPLTQGKTPAYIYTTPQAYEQKVRALLKDFYYPEFSNYSEINISAQGTALAQLSVEIPRVHRYAVYVKKGKMAALEKTDKYLREFDELSGFVVSAPNPGLQENVIIPAFSVSKLRKQFSGDMDDENCRISLDEKSESVAIIVSSFPNKRFSCKLNLLCEGISQTQLHFTDFKVNDANGDTASVDKNCKFTLLGSQIQKSWRATYSGDENIVVADSGLKKLTPLSDGTYSLTVSVRKKILPVIPQPIPSTGTDPIGEPKNVVPNTEGSLPLVICMDSNGAGAKPFSATVVITTQKSNADSDSDQLLTDVLFTNEKNLHKATIYLPEKSLSGAFGIQVWDTINGLFYEDDQENGYLYDRKSTYKVLQEDKTPKKPVLKSSSFMNHLVGAILGIILGAAIYAGLDFFLLHRDYEEVKAKNTELQQMIALLNKKLEEKESSTSAPESTSKDTSDNSGQSSANNTPSDSATTGVASTENPGNAGANSVREDPQFTEEYNKYLKDVQSLDFDFAKLQEILDWKYNNKEKFKAKDKNMNKKLSKCLTALDTIYKTLKTKTTTVDSAKKAYGVYCDRSNDTFPQDVRQAIYCTYGGYVGNDGETVNYQSVDEKTKSFNESKKLIEKGNCTFRDFLNIKNLIIKNDL